MNKMNNHTLSHPISAQPGWLSVARATAMRHLADPQFGNERFARLLFLSPKTLSRRMLIATGLTVNKYLLNLRLEEAKRRLDHHAGPPLTSLQLAQSIGFQKASYFAGRFRDRYGVSPTEYQKHNRV